LRCVATGEGNRNTIGVSVSLSTQRHATHRAAVMEISLSSLTNNDNNNNNYYYYYYYGWLGWVAVKASDL